MLAAAVALLLGSVPGAPELAGTASTATTGLALDAPPLSEEDLALIATITDTASAAPPAPAPIAMFDRLRIGRDRLIARVPRTLGEALLSAPTAISVRRHRVGGDDPLTRGRGAARLAVRLDGLSLEHALSRFDDLDALDLIDPWFLEDVTLGGADRLELRTPAPSGALRERAVGLGRSADRSTSALAILDGSAGPVGLWIGGRYEDYGRLRTDADHDASPWPYQRAGLHARARLWGRDDEAVGLVLGADLDRLTNVEGRTSRDELRLQHAGTAALTVRAGPLEVRAVGGVRNLEVERDPRASITAARVLTAEGRLTAEAALGPLRLGLAGGALDSGASDGASGHTRRLEGALTVRLDSAWMEVDAEAGVAALSTEVATVRAQTTGLVTRGELAVRPLDALAMTAAWRYTLRLPSAGDVVALGPWATEPERTLTLEAGPRLALATVDASIIGYARWLARALEPTLGGSATYVEGAIIGGFEARAAWRPWAALTLEGALGWTAADRVLAGIPGLVAAGRACWTGAEGRWWVEAHVRGVHATATASPAEAPPPRTLSVVDRGEWSRALVGAAGGVTLGAGFALVLAVDNAFDVRTRGYGSAINDPGVDLRAALTHAW